MLLTIEYPPFTMPKPLPEHLVQMLSNLGQAIDIGRQPTVFDGGVVGFSDAAESEVMRNVAGQETGSQSGPRSGRRARARRTETADHPFRSDALEEAHGAEFRILARHYQALAFEERNGLWVVVKSHPLGFDGPEVQFLIAAPLDRRLAPRAWAFAKIGPRAALMSLKHTNFPDASICAFTPDHWPWPNPDGLLGLVDIYVLWTVRKLHRDHCGWWPGPQLGACAHYRVREFDPREDCGCGSNKRYGDCHLPADMLVAPAAAEAEFRGLFSGPYDHRRAPQQVLEAARSAWRKMPSMATVYAHRPDPSGVYMI
jgi:hypothetical protein